MDATYTITTRQAVDAHLARLKSVKRSIDALPKDLTRFVDDIAKGKISKTHPALNDLHVKEWMLLTGAVVGSAGHSAPKPAFDGFSFDGATTIGMMRTDYNPADIARGIAGVTTEYQAINNPTYFVTADIMSLVQAAADKIDPEPIRATDPIAPSGLIMFEHPMVYGDYHPETGVWCPDIEMGIRAISWETTTVGIREGANIRVAPGIRLSLYTDAGLMANMFYPSWEKVGIPIEKSWVDFVAKMPDSELIPTDMHGWAFDVNWSHDASLDARDVDVSITTRKMPTHITMIRTWFLSFMRFCWQELLTVEPAPLPRPVRRAAVRQLGHDNILNIVKLRRARHSSESTGTGHRLDHLVVVRGHWRNQYYPSLGAATDPASHRLIWINPHLRGPEDGELIEHHKVTMVSR